MTGFAYQVVFLGKTDERANLISDQLRSGLVDLGIGAEAMSFIAESDSATRNRRLPVIAVFLGYTGAVDDNHSALASLLDDSVPIVTVVDDLSDVAGSVPQSLVHINAAEAPLRPGNFDRVVSVIMEGFRLLRRERRLFISYKRVDSQAVANQLYDALDGHGFDVFIDTRSVPPGEDFQAELWHRLADSDVVILIDTPRFRASRWTTEELARANASNIQILHLLWPGQSEDDESSFSHFYSLEKQDFESEVPDSRGTIAASAVAEICRLAERLRARAIAARHRYLVDSFCDAAKDLGLLPVVQPRRWISIALEGARELAVVPTVGIPTSTRINDVFDEISVVHGDTARVWVLYDHRGVLASWVKHLQWLDSYLPARSVALVAADQALQRELLP